MKSGISGKNEFGNINNSFDSVTAIDSAFTDEEGRLFLFANDQYVRYSESNQFVDSGYPKSIAEDWPSENHDIEFPEHFQNEPDAAFEGTDNKNLFLQRQSLHHI